MACSKSRSKLNNVKKTLQLNQGMSQMTLVLPDHTSNGNNLRRRKCGHLPHWDPYLYRPVTLTVKGNYEHFTELDSPAGWHLRPSLLFVRTLCGPDL